jgi:galactokinase
LSWEYHNINMEVPTATSLSDIYPEDALPVETKRWESLLAKFKDLYGKQADFVARSPGRVNIIGEVRRSCRGVTSPS